jgi:agmatine deiminase
MPAEWEPHAATWLAWPRNAETWIDRLDAMPAVWAKMAAALSPHEPVNVLVNDREAREAALVALRQAGAHEANLRFHLIPSNDAWIRDFGPTFVETATGEQAILDWRYNAWGGKYPPWDDDDRARVRISEALGLRYYSPGITMEGGAVDVNGRGTLLTCELCVLNPNRNPKVARADMERHLKQCLGVSKVLWLAGGLAGDETDGHIDILARFLDPTTVMVMVEEDPKSKTTSRCRTTTAGCRG